MKSVIESFTTDEIEQRTLPIIRKELAQQANKSFILIKFYIFLEENTWNI